MHNLVSKNWGKSVASMLILDGKSFDLDTPVIAATDRHVDNNPMFYALTPLVLPALFHCQIGSFISVTEIVLHSFHTTYNKLRQLFYLNLVINS